MAGKPWSPDELAFAESMFQNGATVEAVWEAMRDVGYQRTVVAIGHTKGRQGWHASIQPAPFPIFNKPPIVTDDALIMSDCHVPYHDSDFCNDVITYALRTGIRQLVLAGDAMDWAALSSFGSLASLSETAEKELIAAENFFAALAEFDCVTQLLGNHEMRMIRALAYKFKAEVLAKLYSELPQLVVTDYHWCWQGHGRDRWRITHPKSAHMLPCSVARRLVAKHNCHVANGHDHVWGQIQTEDARHFAISTGVCLMPAKIDYISLIDSTRWRVAQGALIIRDGQPELLHPGSPQL